MGRLEWAHREQCSHKTFLSGEEGAGRCGSPEGGHLALPEASAGPVGPKGGRGGNRRLLGARTRPKDRAGFVPVRKASGSSSGHSA